MLKSPLEALGEPNAAAVTSCRRAALGLLRGGAEPGQQWVRQPLINVSNRRAGPLIRVGLVRLDKRAPALGVYVIQYVDAAVTGYATD
jgi:hypothetical protein